MRRTIRTFVIATAALPGLASAASPLRLDCSAEQTHPGRALVCEYAMLGRLNAQLADLHDRAAASGRAARLGVRRWLALRDACDDVDCLDRLLEAAIREARIALVDVEARGPSAALVSARGAPLRAVEEPATKPASPPPSPQSVQEPAVPRSSFGTYAALIFVAAALAYAVVARRLTS